MGFSRVSVISSGQRSDFDAPNLPASFLEQRWFAVYTSANHEKSVKTELDRRCIECFLPLYSMMRRWKDRRIRLERPLFPGYVFVHFALNDRVRVLQIPGVVRLVGFAGQPTPLPDLEIEALRSGLSNGLRAVPHPWLQVGKLALINSGPLAGLRGVIARRKADRLRIVLSVGVIMRSVTVEVDAGDIEQIRSSPILGRDEIAKARSQTPC